MTRDDSPPPGIAAAGDFRTTHWSLVMAARHAPTALSQKALEQLCRTYWFPVYAFIRRRGYGAEDAQDLAQGFFARVLETETLLQADAAKGRFRTFLLTLLTRFLATEFERAGALKRGGGAERIELDAADAEARYAIEPRDTVTPEVLFERQWADALLGRVLDRLRVEFDGASRAGRFEVLKGFLLSPAREVSYAEVAAKLGMTESALPFRFASRFRFLEGGAQCLFLTRAGVRLGDLLPGRERPVTLPHGAFVVHAEFSPEGRTLVTASFDGTARLWDAATGQPTSPPLVHEGRVRSAHSSPDSRRVVTVGLDRRFRLWRVPEGTPESEWLPTPGVTGWVEFSRDGRQLLLAGSAGLHSWQVDTLPLVARPLFTNHPVRMARLAPDGRSWAAIINPEIAVPRLEYADGDPTGCVRFSVPLSGSSECVDISPDGRFLVSSIPGSAAQIRRLPGGEPVGPVLQHDGEIILIRWSHDGRRILTASRDRSVRLWDAAKGQPVGQTLTHGAEPWTAQWSPEDDRVLTGTADDVWRMWDSATGLPLTEPLPHYICVATPHAPPSTSARFSPDGSRIVLGTDGVEAVVLEAPRLTAPIPRWLPEVAEGFAGVRFHASGALVPVEEGRLIEMGRKVAVESGAGNGYWDRWLRWVLADRSTRLGSPMRTGEAGLRTPDAAAGGDLMVRLREARMRRGDRSDWLALAEALEADRSTNQALSALQARWLRRQAETSGPPGH